MSTRTIATHATAPTQFIQVGRETYAYRCFGAGPGLPLLFLQHFTGTLRSRPIDPRDCLRRQMSSDSQLIQRKHVVAEHVHDSLSSAVDAKLVQN